MSGTRTHRGTRRLLPAAASAVVAALVVVIPATGATASPSAAQAAGVASVRAATAVTVSSASDTFARTVASGWGTAERGGAWTAASATHSVVVGSARERVIAAGRLETATLDGYAAASTDLRVAVALDKAPAGGATYVSVLGRKVGTAGDYRARVKVLPGGQVSLILARSSVTLKSLDLAGLSYTAGTKLALRVQVTGTSPTTIRAKAWKVGAAEPSSWLATTTDSTAALQKAGTIATETYISGSATNAPVTAAFSAFSAGPVLANVAPVSAMTTTVNDLTASFDSASSADTDGSIAERSWTFGDGATASGPTATHAYANGGTYAVALKVTDNEGAQTTSTSSVTVMKPNVAPVAALTVSAQNLVVTASGAASSDSDGQVASYGWTFGDGSSASGATANHTYAAAGAYDVRLTVTDNRGASATKTSAVTVTAPVVVNPVGPAGPDTTGVPAGKQLTVHEGNLTITQPGTVIDGLDIRGLVRIKASGVVIKNSIIRGTPLTSNMGLITNDLGAYSFTIEDSEIRPTQASVWVNGIIGHNFTVRRTEISGVVDSIHITGSNVLVEDSWLHSNLFYAQDPNHNGGPSHSDNVQIQAGSNLKFLRNRIEGAYSSAFQTTQDRGVVTGVTIEGNRIGGGGCTVNVAFGSYAPITGFTVQDNVFSLDSRHARCGIIAPTQTSVTNVRNYYTDGSAVGISRG